MLKIDGDSNISNSFRYIGKGVSKKPLTQVLFRIILGLRKHFQVERGFVMTWKFPSEKVRTPDDLTLRVCLDMTFDVPNEIAEQLELWGLNTFQKCEYDQDHRQLKVSAATTLYRKGA